MEIEIWSDFACPFCYIGKRRLDRALEKFPQRDDVRLQWRSYLLFPGKSMPAGAKSVDAIAAIKGISRAESLDMHQYIDREGRKSGLSYNMTEALFADTLNAHRLAHFARSKDANSPIEEVLFEAAFCRALNIGDVAVLEDLGVQAGLEREEVRAVLAGNDFKNAVLEDAQAAKGAFVSSVPVFLFERRISLIGARSEEDFLKALEKAQAAQ